MPRLAVASIAKVQNMRSLLAIIVISSLLAFDLALDGGLQLKALASYSQIR
jgi:hypothetical protein